MRVSLDWESIQGLLPVGLARAEKQKVGRQAGEGKAKVRSGEKTLESESGKRPGRP